MSYPKSGVGILEGYPFGVARGQGRVNPQFIIKLPSISALLAAGL